MPIWQRVPLLSKLSAKSLILLIISGLILVLIPATITPAPLFVASGRLLLGVLAVNLILCTVRHWQRLPVAVIVIHGGVLAILAGGVMSHAGFIATINIHEGGASSTAFRWDREEEMPLGFTLMVKKVHQQYYPTAVKIGVHMDGKAERLYQLRTGETFDFQGHQVELLELDPVTPAVLLAVTDHTGGRSQYAVTREIDLSQPGLVLQLVAFQTPLSRRSWVDLDIIPESGPALVGQAEVNSPLCWRGLRFFHTATGVDPEGRRYAGIQIVKDQGIPLVYGGFAMLSLGNLLWLMKKGGRKRSDLTNKQTSR